MRKVYYKDYDGRYYVDEVDLKKLSSWLIDGLSFRENFYKKNELGHTIIRIIKSESFYVATIKKLSEVRDCLFEYETYKIENISSVEEAKLRSELIAKEFGYKQEMTLGLK